MKSLTLPGREKLLLHMKLEWNRNGQNPIFAWYGENQIHSIECYELEMLYSSKLEGILILVMMQTFFFFLGNIHNNNTLQSKKNEFADIFLLLKHFRKFFFSDIFEMLFNWL